MRGFPLGGRELWDLRCAGKRPEDMVVVSLLGPKPTPNPLLWVGDSIPDAAIRSLEWRMVAGLDVEVWASGATRLQRVLAVLTGILPHAADVFVYYPDAGFRVAVRWLDPRLPVRVIDIDGDRDAALVVARRLGAELRV